MRLACPITKADVHLLLSHDNSGYANAPQCYVHRTLPSLLGVGLLPYRRDDVFGRQDLTF
jgi:hypothetical protein